jgi:hypothetical protein
MLGRVRERASRSRRIHFGTTYSPHWRCQARPLLLIVRMRAQNTLKDGMALREVRVVSDGHVREIFPLFVIVEVLAARHDFGDQIKTLICNVCTYYRGKDIASLTNTCVARGRPYFALLRLLRLPSFDIEENGLYARFGHQTEISIGNLYIL